MAAPWKQIKTTEADWAKADPLLLGRMLTQLHLIRAFEEKYWSSPMSNWCTAPRTPQLVRRAALLARSSACAPATRSMAPIAAITNSGQGFGLCRTDRLFADSRNF
jgi:hypothetical protein